ncbi:MAG: ABC transporter permease [Burkholderiales bacterium]|nr:ABC transporter permease [Burkholderiales bacterium]
MNRIAAPLLRIASSGALFLALAAAFFLLIGRHPLTLIAQIVDASVGSGYALSESLVRATPILLCALATAVPARAGLVSVGAEGQLYFGALVGTGFVLAQLQASTLLPGMLIAGMVGGALWAALPALLRIGLAVNETISTLLLNYVASLLVVWVVFGPWKNPASQGWPATAEFPPPALPPTWFDSRIHLGLWLGIAAAIGLHLVLTRTRWGLALDVIRGNPRVARLAGLDARRWMLATMLVGGSLAGLAGILETASIQGRLQANLSAGAGFSGFLVAWLAGNDCLRIIPLAFLVGALLAAGDGIQMLADVPSSVTLVAQGLLFVAVLFVDGWRRTRGIGTRP